MDSVAIMCYPEWAHITGFKYKVGMDRGIVLCYISLIILSEEIIKHEGGK